MTDADKRAEAEQHVHLVNTLIASGFPARAPRGSTTQITAVRAAADKVSIHPRTFADRVGTVDRMGWYERDYGIKPNWGLERQEVLAEPAAEPAHRYEKPRIRVKAVSSTTPPGGELVRIMALGDVHSKPGRSTETVELAARHAAATRPDRIVQIGDWLSLDSCSQHSARGSKGDMSRSTFPEDLDAGEESLAAFNRECPEDIPRDIVLGNHEFRAWRWADQEPKTAGDLPMRIEQLFARYRWKTHPFGKIFYTHGVGFVHVPLNSMGKPYGGKSSENTIGNDLTHSLVWGHDHRFRFKQVAKIGDNNRIGLCNLGTAMPHGVVEDYSVGTCGWTYGLVDLTIHAGQLIGAKFYDVIELRQMYG